MNYFGNPEPDSTSVEPKMKLTRNRCKCLCCGEVLESTFRHDFVMCKCENQTFTDGGLDYCRRGAMDFTKIEDMCVWEEVK